MSTTHQRTTASDGAARDRGPTLAVIAAIAGAVGAAACCILPLALFTLGVTGVWIGALTALAPYQPLFLTVAVAGLAYGFHRVYRRPKVVCGADGCARPLPRRAVTTARWLATGLVVAAAVYPYLAPTLLGT